MKTFLFRRRVSSTSFTAARVGAVVLLTGLGLADVASAAEPVPVEQAAPPAPVQATVQVAAPAPETQPVQVVAAAPAVAPEPVVARNKNGRPVLRKRYYEGSPVPAGYAIEESPNRAMVWGGALAAGIPYLIGLSGALVSDFKGESGWLAIPVAGPWLMRAQGPRDTETRVILGLDGLVQGVGVILVGVGFALTKKELVWTGIEDAWLAPRSFGPGSYGLAAGAKF